MPIPADWDTKADLYYAADKAQARRVKDGQTYEKFAAANLLNPESVTTWEKWVYYRWLAERVMFDWLPNVGSE